MSNIRKAKDINEYTIPYLYKTVPLLIKYAKI